jgi:hypothetical protein
MSGQTHGLELLNLGDRQRPTKLKLWQMDLRAALDLPNQGRRVAFGSKVDPRENDYERGPYRWNWNSAALPN